MKKVSKTRKPSRLSSKNAFERAVAFREAVIQSGGSFVGYEWALIKTPARSAALFNVAFRLDGDRVHARALTPGHDLRRLRATLAAMGFAAHSVRAATEAERRKLLAAFMLREPPPLPRLIVQGKRGERIICTGATAVEIALGVERQRNALSSGPIFSGRR